MEQLSNNKEILISKIDQVKNIILKLAPNEKHSLMVCYYALKLGEKLGANLELIEVASLLHDIGRLKFGPVNHEITGANEAENILQNLGYKDDFIFQVKHCILAHRGKIEFLSLEAEILANADAMEHFDNLDGWFEITKKKGINQIDAKQWIAKKLQRDWDEKLTIIEAKEKLKDKYEKIKKKLK